ncbi:hypothetical protein H4R34_001953 [Dimargaris verticillata]|uniref:Uncharacterized protein n=1 Tax=Dimargaris verticillata TaxID=2761393 RepID=A0A9W8B2N2_9FUNG|nr:hypothetical protein H4R34_001953 [Dimargaris verticillata]
MRRTGVNDDNIVAEDLLGLSEPLPMVYASQYYEDEFKHNILTRFAQLQSLDDVLVHLVIASQADDTVSAFVTSQLYILMETLDNHATQGTDATAQAFNDAGIVSEYFELLKEDALQGSDEGDTHFYERACEILHELVAPYLAVQAQGITVRYSEQVARYSGSQLTPDSMFAYSLVQAIADMGLAPTQNDDVLVRDTAQRITVESPQELAQEFVVGLFRSRAMILKKPM